MDSATASRPRPSGLSLMFLLSGVFLIALYLLAGDLCLKIRVLSGLTPVIWLPTGIALGALVLVNFRLWPFVFIGSLLFQLLHGHVHSFSVVIAIGATVQCSLGAYALRKYCPQPPTLSNLREIMVFVVGVMGISVVTGALIEVVGYYLDGRGSQNFLLTLGSWWLGEALGTMIIAGGAIAFWNHSRFRLKEYSERKWEALVIFVLLLGDTVFNFTPLTDTFHNVLVRPYLQFPLILWACVRFDLLGWAACMFVCISVIICGSLMGFVPFSASPELDRMMLLQIYLSALSATGFVLAATVLEKKSAVEARNEFIRIASHELKTPITSLKLQLYILQKVLTEGHGQLNEKDAPKQIARINNQMGRLTQIIDQLLDITRIEKRDLSLSPEEVMLSNTIKNLNTRFSADLSYSGCSVKMNLDDSIVGFWDPFRLEQVLDNIISNAIKYAPQSMIEIQTKQVSGNAELIIRDHGPGIDHAKLPFIFDRYIRANNVSSVKGLGLGLFIAKQIVTALGGSIRVESSAKKGTAFYLVLPLGKNKAYSENPKEQILNNEKTH